jgi:hypothetical protein
MNATFSVRDGLRPDRPVLGVLTPLLKLFVVSTRESLGNVRALPRLGLGLADPVWTVRGVSSRAAVGLAGRG